MSIKKLSKDVIAYVCAGVHIVDQAHAIEETIQNSLEAGATTIEVR
jgi:DNA mismatch repair ATPase MutL